MSKIIETSLVLRKETKIEKIRKILLGIFFREEYLFNMELENLLKINRPNPSKVVIPKEIKSEKYKRL